MKNSGDVKYLLHGARNDFQMFPIEKDEGLSLKSTDEINGKKKYTAKMYKANTNFLSRDKKVAIKGDGAQMKVFKMKANNIEKELLPTNTVVYNESDMNSGRGGGGRREYVIPIIGFINMVGGLIKTGMEMGNVGSG